MKRLFLTITLLAFCYTASAQDSKFGITAGYQSSSFEISGDGVDLSTDASGFFLGFFAQFSVSESLSIQPELHYSSVSDSDSDDNDDESVGDIIIPIMLKFHVSDKFNLMAGPQIDYITEEDTEGIKKFGMGLGYDISDSISLGARYSLGFDRLDDEGEDIGDANFKINVLQIGLSYSF